MWSASDIAKWWEEQRRQSSKELERFVDNNPNLFGVIVATSVETAMQLGGGIVDSLNFGEGMAEGGIQGVGKDTLRLIGLLGPLGRGGKLLHTGAIARNARIARLIRDPGGPICGWVSGTQAFRHTGTKLFVAVDDLAKALGKTMQELGASTLAERIALFKGIGAQISALRRVSTWDDIVNMTRSDGSVTMFNVFGKRMNAGRLEDFGHAVYAFRDYLGRLRILDRGGRAGKVGEMVESLEALAKKYSVQGGLQLREAAVMENVFAKFLEGISAAPAFALSVYGLAAAEESHHETVAQAFEVSKSISQQGKPALEARNPRYHKVASGDSLSKIAQSFYKDMHKWPVIFEANRDIIGSNPNVIKPGQKLLIPDLPTITSQ